MRKRWIIAIVIVAAAVLAFSLTFHFRGRIARRVYFRTGERLADKLPPKLAVKYYEELGYTLDKFWSCYESDIVSQNDLTDVMERMRRLEQKDEVTDREIFDLIGYVSRIYVDAIREYNLRKQDAGEVP